MATLSFEVRGKKENANIGIRISLGRGNSFRCKTDYLINPKDWNAKKKAPNEKDVKGKNLKTKLDRFKIDLNEKINQAIENNINIDAGWLQEQADLLQGKRKIVSFDILVNYFDRYINELPTKIKPNGTQGTKPSTITKYKTLKRKIEDFEKYSKKTYLVKDVNLEFRDAFSDYLRDVDKLHLNTIGRYIPFLKTVCRDAKVNGIETHYQLDAVKGYTVKAEKIFLTFDELAKIQKVELEREALVNARDWLVIGCYIGQRVSDLLPLTKDSLISRNGLEFIELTQQKTGKSVVIPIHPIVRDILEKRNGEFPRRISAAKFNLHIKDVGELAGLTELTVGGKINPDTNRKEHGTYPKCELITSHICRRSFATNFYGDIPTSLLMRITAHSTEKMFLEYIGKSEIDHALQLAEYWTKQALQVKKEPQLTVVKKAY